MARQSHKPTDETKADVTIAEAWAQLNPVGFTRFFSTLAKVEAAIHAARASRSSGGVKIVVPVDMPAPDGFADVVKKALEGTGIRVVPE